jgi:hypothetical protein
MVNRPKNIGTWTETQVVRYARANGFAAADRRTQKGRYDVGDILLCPGAIIEVKGGKAAKTASHGQINAWCDETVTEIRNARADIGLLVLHRAGAGATRVGEWRAFFPPRILLLAYEEYEQGTPAPRLEVTLHDALTLLRQSGWGDPT